MPNHVHGALGARVKTTNVPYLAMTVTGPDYFVGPRSSGPAHRAAFVMRQALWDDRSTGHTYKVKQDRAYSPP